jgi:phage-related minor tail protein
MGNAAALQKVTKFSDESVMASQGMLLTFTKIGKDIFPAATMATLDMAEKFGMDASQAAITLGKALNDPVSGVTALRRIGVMLTDDQESQIKSFMAVNDVASAQAIIMKELQVEIGGVAEAAGATTAGSFEQFKNQFDDIKETIGTSLIPVLVRLMEAITPLIEKFAAMSPEQQNMILGIIGLVAVLGPAVTIIGGLVTAIGAIVPVITAVAGAIAPFILPILAIIAVIALLYVAWTNNWGGIQEKFAAFVAWIKPIWDAVWAGLVVAFTYVWDQIKTIWEAFSLLFQGDFYGFGEKLREAWDRMWEMIKTVASTAWEFLKEAFVKLVAAIVDYFKNIDWKNLGKNIIDGIINGLRNGIGAVIAAAKSVAKAASQAVSGFLGIKSPSTVFQGYGQMVTEGFAKGITDSKLLDVSKAFNLENFENKLMTPGISASTATPASSKAGNNITINVTNPKGETSEASVRKTLKSLSYLGVVS